MTEPGFQIDIALRDDGLLYGGNAHNCGTWMDKMGSAPSNRGRPATPRDGAPIECSALLYSTLRWLASLPVERFPHGSVQWSLDGGARVTWHTWAERIERHFAREGLLDEEEAVEPPPQDRISGHAAPEFLEGSRG